MAVIDKISVKNTSYDIGADSNNVVYDSNNSVKDKIDEYEAIIPSSASSSNKLATTNDIPSLTNYIQKSQTTGLVKNDGTIDTNTYLTLVPTATSSALGLVKPDNSTITVDANGVLSASADLSNYIQKSATEGLVKNDGTIDESAFLRLKFGLTGNLSTKAWTGLIGFDGYYIWTDGDNIYISNGGNQFVLDKSTSTWNYKTWNGYSRIDGSMIWIDGDNIYYSNEGNNYVLDKSTSTWSTKTWNGLTSFYGYQIWTDGDNIYYSEDSKQYVLDKSTSAWSTKTWNGLTSFYGAFIWTDGTNIYYSYTDTQCVLNKSTSTWNTKTWNGNGLTNFNGYQIWTDGNNIYYSGGGSTQYVFDKTDENTDGFVKSDGTIDTNTYAQTSDLPGVATASTIGLVKPDGTTTTVDANGVISSIASGGSTISKKRYTITASSWSNSVDANGYYTYTITLSNPTLDTSYPPNVYLTGVDDNTFYTDTEAEQYSYVAQCNLTASTTLVLYAKTKPDTTFYVFVEGLEA